MSFRVRVAALLILAFSMLSCGDDGTVPDSITITPTSVEIFVGASRQLSVLDAPTTVVWSSSDDDIASVVPETGFVVAISRGAAVITATSGSASAQVTVTVLAPRSLALTPPVLNFQALVGAANPPNQTVTVSNAGDGAITNVAAGALVYGDGQPTGWLSFGATSNTAPVTFTFTASAAGLPRGTYSASLSILADGIDNSPQQLLVNFTVQAPASIAVSRTTVPIQAIPGAVIVEQVSITNPGDIPLTGLSQSIIYNGAPGQTWLNVSLNSTSAPSASTLTVNTTGLVPGNYSATVRIALTVPGVANRDVAVALTVIPGPSIVLSSTNVVLNAAFGVNPQAPTIAVTNGGGGILSGLAFGTVTYGAGQPQGWLTPSLGGVTSAPATITLNIASAALASGVYTATVPVLSNVATNSPRNITVTLTVGTAPTMQLSRTSVPMSGIPGTIQNEVVNITSSGAQIAGLSRTITYQVGQPQGWLTSATFNSNTTPSILTLVGNATGLAPAVYTATVTVSSTTPGVSSRDITVTFTVTPGPTIALSPNPVVVNQNFGLSPAPIVVNVTNAGGGTLNNLSLGTPTYTGTNPGWLTGRVLNAQSAPTFITLTISSSGLPSGSYSATVPVQSTVAGNSPANLVVNLTVLTPPVIALNPNTALSFAAWGNAVPLPTSQNIAITNIGGSSLTGLSVAVAYTSGAPAVHGWLNNIQFFGSNNAPTTMSVQPSTTARDAGTYTATITLSSSAPGVTPRMINVSYAVQTFTTNVHPFFGPAGCGGCHDSGIRPPVFSATPLTYYNNIKNNGDLSPLAPQPNNPDLYCRIFGPCPHTGGKFTGVAGFQSAVLNWILAGAPFR